MNNTTVTTQSPKLASEKRYTRILLLIVLILAGISIVALISNKPSETTTSTVGSIPLPNSSRLPGHNFGAIYGEVDPGANKWGSQLPFVTTIAGQTVIRRSELGPLTEIVADPPKKHGPGHDYGSIGCADDPVAPLENGQTPFSYTVAGVLVTRKSEMGPLTTYADKTVIACLP